MSNRRRPKQKLPRRKAGESTRRVSRTVAAAGSDAEAAQPVVLSDWQRDAVADLEAAAAADLGLRIESDPVVVPGLCHVPISLDTVAVPRTSRGLRLEPRERFLLSITENDSRPPHVTVAHERFLGTAHVMSGYELCLYLDISREWDPGEGINGLLRRLRKWLHDAAGNKFNTDTALFHAVGGTPHIDPNGPTIVVRDELDLGGRPTMMYLHHRDVPGNEPSPRYDLVDTQAGPDDLIVPVVPLRRDLPIGAGHDTLDELLDRIQATQGLAPRDPLGFAHQVVPALVRSPVRRNIAATVTRVAQAGAAMAAPSHSWMAVCDRPKTMLPVPESALRLVQAVVDAAVRNAPGSEQVAVVAVPHPAGGARHLISLRIPAGIADAIRRAVRTRAEHGRNLDPMEIVAESQRVPMRWCRVSDERPIVTTRRDVRRPVTVLYGKTVHVWGVGGLGSWMAEYVVRAGAARVVLTDPGIVTGGLLVRQNFVEDDIGRDKATALMVRLRAIRDDVEVVVEDSSEGWGERIAAADLVVDATVSRPVTRFFDWMAQVEGRRVTIAQVATDVVTGTLGIAIVSCPGDDALTELDRDAFEQVRRDPSLEEYLAFWADPPPGSEFVPTRGCSIPTFHGSAADLAGVASSLLNFVCLHLDSGLSGVELFALPHTMVSPSRKLLVPGRSLDCVA